MARIYLETPRFYLEIDPDLGAGVAEFSLRSEGTNRLAIMRTASRDAGWFNDLACYLLAPWSNRIKGARFQWCGNTYALPADWTDGTAIHGLVKDKPFRIVERSPVSALLCYDHQPGNAKGWPWSFRCDVRYQLSGRGMQVRLRLTNMTDDMAVPMPAGVGFHPFFPRVGPASVDPASIRYDHSGRYPAEAMLPTAPAGADETTELLASGKPLGPRALDDVFLGCPNGAELRCAGRRLRYTCSPNLGHAVIYTGAPDAACRMPALCFEPVTMVNDGFNLHSQGWANTGVQSLGLGQTLEVSWGIEVED